jgi:predicted RNA-binding Zn ribbon-like protein
MSQSFDMSGGALCLDFANTARWTGPPREDLPAYDALLAWSEQAGLLEKADARAIRSLAEENPHRGRAVLERARKLREAVHRTFAAVAAKKRARPEDLVTIERAAAEAAAHFRIVPRNGGFGWEVAPDSARALERPLWPVARSAADLLTSGDLSTVRECALETCSWLFLDRSKNQKRRWCDMKVCGNRSKARRHYARTRGRQ